MIIARDNELKRLRDTLKSEYSSFVAVYGRRRVGKTYLIREAFGYDFTFQHSGLYKQNRKQQLEAFVDSIRDAGLNVGKTPKNWIEAFGYLKQLIKNADARKKVIFLDELSWMDTHKSDFMAALEFFWNGWASGRKDVVLIVCASATSWMMRKVIHNKGGLYNRLNFQIHVKPFNLYECEEYSRALNLPFNRLQLAEYYMVAGGIPYYWSLLKPQYGVTQNIDYLYFGEDARLSEEFKYLFASLFESPEPYLQIVVALTKKKGGMTRNELIEATSLTDGGPTGEILENLESCDFIRKYYPMGKKKDATYQLIDNFTLFHYQFLHNTEPSPNYWTVNYNTPTHNTWRGLAFERLCLLHTPQIKQALGIIGIASEEHSWSCKKDMEKGIQGSQIDFLIYRGDPHINVCEMKYREDEYEASEADYNDWRRKISDLSKFTKKGLILTLVTPFGLHLNPYGSIVQAVVTLDDLFAPLPKRN